MLDWTMLVVGVDEAKAIELLLGNQSSAAD